MLLIQDIPATALRPWSHHATEFKPKPTEPSNLIAEESSQGAGSSNGVAQASDQTSGYGYSTPASASSGNEGAISHQAVHYNMPINHSASSDAPIAHDPCGLDATTFSHHAVDVLPSEPNGSWCTQASYATTSSSESARTLQDVAKQHWPELDFQTLYYKLRVVARNTKDDLEGYMNQKLAGTDLVNIHDRIRRTASNLSLPNKRQINCAFDQVLDVVTEVAQLLKEDRSESELLEDFKDDKYIFADILSRMAQRALAEQGICKKWQLQCDRHVQLQHAMQTALIHTFTQIQQAYKDVPLFHARPEWIAGREKVWRLELDVGKVGVEVGPVTDWSLIELGPIDTGIEFPEFCGCASITDIDCQEKGVDDEWQLLEA